MSSRRWAVQWTSMHGAFLTCEACGKRWAEGEAAVHAKHCPVGEVIRLQKKLERRRRAALRLRDYWKVQLDGAESLHTVFSDHWFTKISRALGKPGRLRLSEILSEIEAMQGQIRELVRQVVRQSSLRRQSEEQCERMRVRWLTAEEKLNVLDPEGFGGSDYDA